MSVPIPESHRDLLQGTTHGVLTTVMADGSPQSSIVWVDTDGTNILLNTTLERHKGRNMCTNPKVTILAIDPNNSSRWIEVRGHVRDLTTYGAEAHADKLAKLYTGKKHFYGEVLPMAQRQKETRVVVTIEPIKISLDAVFK